MSAMKVLDIKWGHYKILGLTATILQPGTGITLLRVELLV